MKTPNNMKELHELIKGIDGLNDTQKEFVAVIADVAHLFGGKDAYKINQDK